MADARLDSTRMDFLLAAMVPRLEMVVELAGRNIEVRAKDIIVAKDIIDTGATLNTVESRRVPGDSLARRIGPTTDYALFLETGTSRMAARPFMVPAKESERAPFNQAVAAVMRT